MSAKALADGIDRFTDLVGRATSWLALGIALVMGANVLLRYGFSIGSIWMQELEWHIMVPICLFGMSYALVHGEHVRVDVVFQYFSQRNKHLVDVITAILAMIFCILVIWLSPPTSGSPGASAKAPPTPAASTIAMSIKSLIPIGFALFFIQSLSEAIKSYLAYRAA